MLDFAPWRCFIMLACWPYLWWVGLGWEVDNKPSTMSKKEWLRSKHAGVFWSSMWMFIFTRRNNSLDMCYVGAAWCCLLLSGVIQFFEILEKWLISCSWGCYFIHGKTQDFPIHWIIQLPGFMSPSWLVCWSPGAQWLRGTLVQPVRVYQGALCEDASMVAA